MSTDIRNSGYFKIMPCGRLNTINYCEKCPNKDSCEHLTRKTLFNFGDHIIAHGKKVTLKDLHHTFKFKCAKCGLCCSDIDIRLSPHDLLRLSHRLQMPVKEFSKKYTDYIIDKEDSFMICCILKTRPDCVFWTQKGCSVYEDRPLACRIYPIATMYYYNKNAYYITPGKCQGRKYGKRIKIKEFLEKSDAFDYMEMHYLFRKFTAILTKRTNFPKNEKRFNTLFIKILYEFDEPEVKQLIKNVTGKENTDDKQTIKNVMETAEKIILKPLLSTLTFKTKDS